MPDSDESTWATLEKIAAVAKGAADAGIDPLFLKDDFVRTYCIARKGIVESAIKSLLGTAEWRETVSAPAGWPGTYESLVPSIQSQLDTGKVFLCGRDKEGRPVSYIRTDRHIAEVDPVPVSNLMMFMMDSMCALLHRDDVPNPKGGVYPRVDKMTIVLDFGSFGFANADTDVGKGIVSMLSRHYPEHLGKMYMVDAGYIAWGVWQIVRLLLDPRSEAKIKFVSRAELQDVIDVEELPTWLGGNNPYEFKPSDINSYAVMQAGEGALNPWLRPIPHNSKYARKE